MFLTTRCLIGLLASTEKMVPEGRLHMRFNWVACLNGENGPGRTFSYEALSVSPQGALEISSVVGQPPALDRNLFSTPRMVAESHKRDERHRPSSQDHSIQLFRDTSNKGWGTLLEQTSTRVCGQTGE